MLRVWLGTFAVITVFIGVLIPNGAVADVQVSKANGYAIVAPTTAAVSVSKANAYAIVAPAGAAVSVSKVVAYAVIAPPALPVQPHVDIMTQNGSVVWRHEFKIRRQLKAPIQFVSANL